MIFSEKLRRLLTERRIEAKEAARLSGIPYNTLRNYAKTGSKGAPSAPKGIALAEVLDVPIKWLFDDSQDWPPPPVQACPPFAIFPWPPTGITWKEVQLALAAYVYRNAVRLYAEGEGPFAHFDGERHAATGSWEREETERAILEQLKQLEHAIRTYPRRTASETKPRKKRQK